VYPEDKSPTDDERERLPANGRLRLVEPLPWWSTKSFKVRVSGFPEQTVTLRPWWGREDRRVPFSFLRPVVLIWAENKVIQEARKPEIKMDIGIRVKWKKSDGKEDERVFEPSRGYHGEAVWIGCGDEDTIDVPQHVLEWWKAPLANPEYAPLLLNPVPLSTMVAGADSLPADLTGATVEAWVKRRGDKKPYETGNLKVRKVLVVPDMVQPLTLGKPL
jgi:hypothetical protein